MLSSTRRHNFSDSAASRPRPFRNIEDPEAPASARVQACKTVLEIGQRGVEIEDFTTRIESLELTAAERNPRRVQ
jgi:hypothetical protein